MNAYDFYLRHAAVREGEWVGFPLAWKGLAGVERLARRPHLRWRPWILDPANPDNPAAGSWGVWQWHFDVAMLDRLAGLLAQPPSDGRTGRELRADLLAYLPLPILELKDVDGEVYSARMTTYGEQAIEPHDAAHPDGGWVAQVEFARVDTTSES